jgi:catechol 2,3-dioxygenase-like lactoylglutathione lyase family enzyme
MTLAKIDHIEIFVSDGAGSRAFYDQVLKPLGIEVKREVGARVKALGYGDDARGPFFWVTPIGTPCFLLAFFGCPFAVKLGHGFGPGLR